MLVNCYQPGMGNCGEHVDSPMNMRKDEEERFEDKHGFPIPVSNNKTGKSSNHHVIFGQVTHVESPIDHKGQKQDDNSYVLNSNLEVCRSEEQPSSSSETYSNLSQCETFRYFEGVPVGDYLLSSNEGIIDSRNPDNDNILLKDDDQDSIPFSSEGEKSIHGNEEGKASSDGVMRFLPIKPYPNDMTNTNIHAPYPLAALNSPERRWLYNSHKQSVVCRHCTPFRDKNMKAVQKPPTAEACRKRYLTMLKTFIERDLTRKRVRKEVRRTMLARDYGLEEDGNVFKMIFGKGHPHSDEVIEELLSNEVAFKKLFGLDNTMKVIQSSLVQAESEMSVENMDGTKSTHNENSEFDSTCDSEVEQSRLPVAKIEDLESAIHIFKKFCKVIEKNPDKNRETAIVQTLNDNNEYFKELFFRASGFQYSLEELSSIMRMPSNIFGR